MDPQMLLTGSVEVWVLSILLLIGVLFILFGKGSEYVFVGMVVIGGVISVTYTYHTHLLGERFLMKQFHEGMVLECGLWRGMSTRVDRLSGWRYEEETGFLKGYVIINDPSVCRVIEKPFPQPSSVLYWIVFVTDMGVLMILRSVTLGIEEEDHDARAE
jgi:hypothetical protein